MQPSGSSTPSTGHDSEANRSSRSSSVVPNVGSAARDYCSKSIERTLLSYARLGLILFVLSCSLLLKARIPDPDTGESGEPDDVATFPLGVVYSCTAIAAILAGWTGYEADLKGLLEERAFVGGFHLTESVVVGVSLLLFATCIILLREDYSVQFI